MFLKVAVCEKLFGLPTWKDKIRKANEGKKPYNCITIRLIAAEYVEEEAEEKTTKGHIR